MCIQCTSLLPNCNDVFIFAAFLLLECNSRIMLARYVHSVSSLSVLCVHVYELVADFSILFNENMYTTFAFVNSVFIDASVLFYALFCWQASK